MLQTLFVFLYPSRSWWICRWGQTSGGSGGRRDSCSGSSHLTSCSSCRRHLSGTQGIFPIMPSLCLKAGLLATTATHVWGLELASSVRVAVHSGKSWGFWEGGLSPCSWSSWLKCQPRTQPHWHYWYHGSGNALFWGPVLYIEECLTRNPWSLPTRHL